MSNIKALIYKYKHNNTTYFVEGYDETTMRTCLEQKLGIESGTLTKGVSPNYTKELKRIWDKNDKAFYLTLKKEETTDESSLKKHKQDRHALYELDLLLSEDMGFIGGLNDIVIKSLDLNLILWTQSNKGYPMAYSVEGSKLQHQTDKIYRFGKLSAAYWYVRNRLIERELAEVNYKGKTITNLEMCDSFIAGFGSANIHLDKNKCLSGTMQHVNHLPLEFVK